MKFFFSDKFSHFDVIGMYITARLFLDGNYLLAGVAFVVGTAISVYVGSKYNAPSA